MFLNNFFRKLADYTDRYHDKKMGDEFRAMIIKQEHPNPDLEYEAARDLEDEQREQEEAEQVSFE